jgi:molybdopterin-guanine dinucleotide biosynthesis protein A
MGADKALLDLQGEPAIVRVVAACRAGGADRVVVVRAKGAASLPSDLPVSVVEVAPDAEMIDSVRAGIRVLDPADAVAVFPVDHALASGDTLRALVRRLGAVMNAPSHLLDQARAVQEEQAERDGTMNDRVRVGLHDADPSV